MEAVGEVGTSKNLVVGDQSGSVLEIKTIKASESGVASYSPEVLQSSVWTQALKSSNELEFNLEKSVVLSNKVDGLEFLIVEPMGIELPMASDNGGLIDPLKALEHETSGLFKDSHKVDIVAPAEDMAESRCLKFGSLLNWPIASGNVPEKSVMQNYPSQRRILDTQDFPSFCGRNASCLSKEECVNTLASSKTKSLGHEKYVVNDKLLKETVGTNVKQLGDDVQDEDSLKSKFKAVASKNSRDQVQAESDGDGTKEASKQVGTGIFFKNRVDWEDTSEKSFRPPCNSYLNHPDHKPLTESKEHEMEVGGLEGKAGTDSVVCNEEVRSLEGNLEKQSEVYNGEVGGSKGKVGKEIVLYDGELGGLEGKVGNDVAVYNGEVRGLEGKVGKESVIHTKDKNLKRKSSGSSTSKHHFQREDVGLKFSMDRVIVQGLKRKALGSSACKYQFQREDMGLESAIGRVIVQGLMAAPNFRWRHGKGAFKRSQYEDNLKSEFKEVVSKISGEQVQAKSEGDGTKEASKQVKTGTFFEIRADWEYKRAKGLKVPCESYLNRLDQKSWTNSKEGEMEVAGLEGKVGKDIVVCNGEVGGLEGKLGKEIVVYNGEVGGLEGKVGKDILVYNRVVGGLEGKVGKESVVHTKATSLRRKFSGSSTRKNQFQIDDVGLESTMGSMIFQGVVASKNQFQRDVCLGSTMGRVIVQGLMATPNFPWRQRKGSFKPTPGEDNLESRFKEIFSKISVDQIQAELEGDGTKKASKQVEAGTFSEIRVVREAKREKSPRPPCKSYVNHPDHNSQTDSKEGEIEVGGLEGKVGKDIVVCNGEVRGLEGKVGKVVCNKEVGGLEGKVGKGSVVHTKDRSLKRKISCSSSTMNQFQGEDVGLASARGRVIVQGLMSASNLSWRQGKMAIKPKLDEDNLKRKFKAVVSKISGDQVQFEFEGDASKKVSKQVEIGTFSEIMVDQEVTREESFRSPCDSYLNYLDHRSQTDSKERELEVGGLEGKVGKDIVVYNREVEDLEGKLGKEIVVYNGEVGGLEGKVGMDIVVYDGEMGGFEGEVGKETAMDSVIVQGLMAATNFQGGKGAVKPNPAGARQGSKGNKHGLSGHEKSKYFLRSRKADTENLEGKYMKKSPCAGKAACHAMNELDVRDEVDYFEHEELGTMQVSKGNKHESSGHEKSKYFLRSAKADMENLGGKYMKKKSLCAGNAAHHAMNELIVRDEVDYFEHAEKHENFQVGFKPNSAGGVQGSKRNKHDLSGQVKSKYFLRSTMAGTENLGDKNVKKKSPCAGKAAYHGVNEPVVRDDIDSFEHEEEHENIHVCFKPNSAGGMQGSKGNKHDLSGQVKSKYLLRSRAGTENLGGKNMKKKSPCAGKAAYHSMNEPVVRDEVDSFEHEEENENFHVDRRLHDFDVSLSPFCPSSSNGKSDDHDAIVTREKVRETLHLFRAACRELMQEKATKSKEEGRASRRVFLQAARILKDKGKFVNSGKQIVGPVPGVEVGDEFHYRVELATIGLHHHFLAVIDYVKQGGRVLATSVVASVNHGNDIDNSDILICTGSGGYIMGRNRQSEDQKLEKGNLALKNSIYAKNPVRVIRGFRETKASYSSDTRAKAVTYIYDGLYLVERCWQELGTHGKLVFKFHLGRIPGQPKVSWNEVKKSTRFKIWEGLRVNDISEGKELIPIFTVNTIDDKKPPPFKYITSMMYPNWCRPMPFKGCNCTGRCSDSQKCSCAVKNGGEIPYNYNGAIVEARPLVFECGPSCKCPPSCHNRVSQQGIKYQLEIFKTESRGWGVRSLNSISSGSFICELLGELLEDKEAELRTGNDEYLFDIGQNYNDHNLWDGLSNFTPNAQTSSCEVVEDGAFTIDAAQYGNVGRFINHSCSPNLYAQNVLYDHEDKRMPHIMLFASEDIPPLQELTYHYNYTIDMVRDSDGNIKKKSCYCGSPECTGRMY